MTKRGQVTWANPEMKEKCESCRHFKKDPNKPLLGKCGPVKAITRKAGASFDGKIAIAFKV